MTAGGRVLGILLAWGVLSLWVEERWPWALFQVGIFVLMACRMFDLRPWNLRRAALPLAAAALWPVLQLSLGATVYRQATWAAFLDWVTFLIVFLLSGEYLGALESRLCFLRAAALFGMAVAAFAAVALYTCPGKVFCIVESGFPDGVMASFVNRNQYSAWVELLLPPALYLAAVESRARILLAAAAAVMTASVAAGGSRAGVALVILEIGATILALAVRFPVQRRRLAFTTVRFVVLAVLAVGLAGWQASVARWRHSGPEILRSDALHACWQMVRQAPWLGSGLGTWSREYPRYASVDQGLFLNQAHNDWAQWAAEGGLPFFFFLVFFAALLWKPAIRSIYGVGVAAFLLHALVDYPMQQRPALAACFFCLAGVVVARQGPRTSADDGLLRGMGHFAFGPGGGDSPGLPAVDATGSPGPLQR